MTQFHEGQDVEILIQIFFWGFLGGFVGFGLLVSLYILWWDLS